ncbi:hypothetical protein LU683_30100 [Pseudomonas asiatica]|uniref:hypothetical protein n=1 Tax=Pseudomonas asiatica TaxID=2219225 RepID=UPI001E5EACFA|nr:hypothetical protein [Pseudomonas asiatica]MCE0757138.1 hypothetical protein [Pseudomonas asiatica]MCE1033013.1 hypothetical protein [Pseudomonas asiatica]MCE1067577.1 hypothetical protein [Pseudomonas asiatica]MCE1102217.1 hypothetical protein [Pseudomonas asiatica]MCE1107770.1 hypothetical protein [Pseudomonas asiatica]
MSKVYLVWNKGRTECVGFTDKDDTYQAAGKNRLGNPCASLSEQWRELYADDDPRMKFEVQEIELGAEEKH